MPIDPITGVSSDPALTDDQIAAVLAIVRAENAGLMRRMNAAEKAIVALTPAAAPTVAPGA